MVSWPDPHHPFNPPGRYWDLYRPEEMELPEAFRRNDWSPPEHVAAALREREDGGAALRSTGTVACTAREALEARALTCGMIAMIDDAVGGIMGGLREAGLNADTVVSFTSDHGDHLGDHRLLFKGAQNYDQLTRVPFIWSDPDGEAGKRTAAIGQSIDIGATILERAKIEAPPGTQGQALPVKGGLGRSAALIQYDHQKVDAGLGPQPRAHTKRTSDWRLTVYLRHEFGDLYDMRNDPGEMHNLWDDAAHAAVKGRLIRELLELEIASVDRAPLPAGTA